MPLIYGLLMNHQTNPHVAACRPSPSKFLTWLWPMVMVWAFFVNAVLPAHAQSPTRPLTPQAEVRDQFEITAELFYLLLIAEIQAAQNDPGSGFSIMLDAAKRTQHPELFRRAVDMALQSRAGNVALDASRDWAQTQPESQEPYRYQLQILLALNRPAEIGPALQNLIRLTPADQRIAVINAIPGTLSRATDKTAAYAAAQNALRAALADRSTSAAAWSALGRMSLDIKDMPGALRAMQNAAQVETGSAEVMALAIDLFENQVADAEPFIQNFLNRPAASNDETYIRTALQYARLLIEQRRDANALAQLAQLIERQPQQAEAWLLQGIVQNQLRQTPAAKASLLQFLELAPNLPVEQAQRGQTQAFLQLAHIAEQDKQFAQALSWLDRIEDTNQLFATQTRRAIVVGKQGRVNEARSLIQSLPDRGPEDARRKLMAEAQLLRELKRFNDAFDVFGQLVERFPEEPNYLYEQAMMAELAGNLGRMEVLLRQLIANQPDFYHAYNALGYSLADRNIRLSEAKSLVQRALAASPNNAYILDSLGWVEFRMGNHAEALRILQQAYDIEPDAEIAAHLGEVYWVLKQREDALNIWREGLLLDANNETLQETLKRFRVKP
jgi:tetratricopeptide (TPR) repeat protein